MKISSLIRKNYLLIALVVITIFFLIVTKGKLFYAGNLINLFQQNMYVFVLASGMFICILTGGNTDLSCGSAICLIGALAFRMMENGLNGFLAFIVMLILGTSIGAIHGYLIGRFKLPSIIVTLASMSMLRGVANLILGGYTLFVEDDAFLKLFGISQGFPFYILFVLFSVLSAVYISDFAPIGKHIRALGGNKEAAKASGINEMMIIMFAYVYMGIMTAIAAGVVTGRMGIVGPGLGETYAMDAIAACFIGGTSVSTGKGKMSGVIIGALLMGIINQGMSILGLSVNYQNVIKGIILVSAVLFGSLLNRKGSEQ